MHSKKIVRLAAVNWAVFVKGFLFQIFTVMSCSPARSSKFFFNKQRARCG